MRALSLKLIRGKIDQVDGTIAVEWVQPRVLQQPQIAKMTERLATWTGTVDSTLKFLEGETPEFLGVARGGREPPRSERGRSEKI